MKKFKCIIIIIFLANLFACSDDKPSKSVSDLKKDTNNITKQIGSSKTSGGSMQQRSSKTFGDRIQKPSFFMPFIGKNGILTKVIVRGLHGGPSNIYEQPDIGSKKIDTVDPMKILFVFTNKSNNIKVNGFYHIGYSPQKEDLSGWICESDVIEWNQRETARFAPRLGRPSARLYRKWETIQSVLVTGHENEKPISEEPPESSPGQKFSWLMPVLDSKNIRVKNETHKVYRLAYLEMPRKAFKKDTKKSCNISLRNFKLDVVFVIDATSSMAPFFPKVKSAVERMGRSAIKLRERGGIRLGLWVYRDRIPNGQDDLGKVTEKVLSLEDGKDIKNFLNAIDTIKITDVSSGDHEEATLEGLYMALSGSNFSSKGLKSIILVGDASGHEGRHPKNPHDLTVEIIMDKAKEKNVRISTLVLQGETLKEFAKFIQQAKPLSSGTGPGMNGVYHAIQDIQNAGMEKFEDKIYNLLLQEAQLLDDLKKAVVDKGHIANLSHDDKAIVLVNLKASTNPLAQGFKKNFSTGWLNGSIDNKDTLKIHILLSISELETMIIYLKNVGRWTNRNPTSQQLDFAKLKALEATLGETIQKISDKEVISEFLKKKVGLPIQTSLLKRTKEELRNMTEQEKKWMLDAVRKKREILEEYSNNQSQWTLLGNGYLISFIPIDLLP